VTQERKNYFDALKAPLRSGGNGTSTIAIVLATSLCSVANYFASDISPTPWREETIRCGFYFKLVLPMSDADAMLDAFNACIRTRCI